MDNTLTVERALRLADVADEITTKFYLSVDLHIEDKPDNTPVTEADLAVEKALSAIVRDEFKEAYYGEEGARDSVEDCFWMADPIDGTKNFMRGMPVWATLISLSDKDGPVAAAVSAPALGRRWWAGRGRGAWTRDVDGTVRQLHVSKISAISNASLLHSSLFVWDDVPTGVPAVLELLRSAWRHRSPGDFLNYMLVAEGAADACFEPNSKQWDIEAPKLIITEAGGSLWTNATNETTPDMPRMIIASNGLLENQLRKVLDKSV